jgi:hypothetical protein
MLACAPQRACSAGSRHADGRGAESLTACRPAGVDPRQTAPNAPRPSTRCGRRDCERMGWFAKERCASEEREVDVGLAIVMG